MEVPFQIDLHDPATGEVLEERLVGALDLVVEQEKKNIVVEHKTAAKKWSSAEIKYDIQLSAYHLVARDLDLGEAGLRLQVFTKTKTPAMVVEDTCRTEQDELDFLEAVVGVLRAVDAHAFFPVRTSKCSGCAFQKRCGGR